MIRVIFFIAILFSAFASFAQGNTVFAGEIDPMVFMGMPSLSANQEEAAKAYTKIYLHSEELTQVKKNAEKAIKELNKKEATQEVQKEIEIQTQTIGACERMLRTNERILKGEVMMQYIETAG